MDGAGDDRADALRCQECNAPIDPTRVRHHGPFDLASCTGCGLQWVRRNGGIWAEIRG